MSPDLRKTFALGVNQRFFYGWMMVVVAMAGYFASGPGQSHIFSVFILPLSTDLGLDQTQISFAYALATLAAAFGLPYIGRLIDRYGMRRVVLITTTSTAPGSRRLSWLSINDALTMSVWMRASGEPLVPRRSGFLRGMRASIDVAWGGCFQASVKPVS